MKIVFAGNNERSYECLSYLNKKDINISLVISHKKTSKEKYFKNLKFLAKKLNLRCISPSNINSKVVKDKLKIIKPDLMILCGYSQNILKKEIFEIPKYGSWNLHASDLPKYRGASPLNWALINNESKIGISIIQIDKSLDGGDIIAKALMNIKKNENIKSLTYKVNKLYPKLLFKQILKLKKGSIVKKKQNSKKATYFTRRFPKDSHLKFNLFTADEIKRIINASIYPYPAAFFYYNKKKIEIGSDADVIKNCFGVPGRITKRDSCSITVICKKNSIRLKEIFYNNKLVNPIKQNLKPGKNLY